MPMASSFIQKNNLGSSLLALQQVSKQYYRDESRLAALFLEQVAVLCDAECLILRRETDSGPVITGSLCRNESDHSPETIMQQIEPCFSESHKTYTDDERQSFLFRGELPIHFAHERLTLSRALFIYSSSFCPVRYELILLNGHIDGNAGELTGDLKGLVNIMSMTKEKAAMEENIRRKEKGISKAVDSKTQFLGSLSHEIRSPLNGIICMASLLGETDLTEDQQELLSIIQFSADNITRIIQDLVDLTLLNSGRVILKNENFSLLTLCGNLIKNMKEEASSKGLDLDMAVEDGIDSFHGDSVRIGQILSNLIQNAIKYTEKGEIFLDVHRRPGAVEFVVSDTGVGIPRDKQDLIFEEFTQLGNSVHKDKVRGVGLGLAIVKDLVEIMGGTVTVKSREGKGSSFCVLLSDFDVQPGKEKDFPREEGTLFLPENSRFLIVDDDEINRLYLRMVLEGIGAHTDEAENGRIAVEKVAGKKYDMVLMDISMPVMNGLDATKEIRKIRKDLPVLAITANAFDEDIQRILESGLDDIVLKPVDEEQLMNKISNWMGRSRGNG